MKAVSWEPPMPQWRVWLWLKYHPSVAVVLVRLGSDNIAMLSYEVIMVGVGKMTHVVKGWETGWSVSNLVTESELQTWKSVEFLLALKKHCCLEEREMISSQIGTWYNRNNQSRRMICLWEHASLLMTDLLGSFSWEGIAPWETHIPSQEKRWLAAFNLVDFCGMPRVPPVQEVDGVCFFCVCEFSPDPWN